MKFPRGVKFRGILLRTELLTFDDILFSRNNTKERIEQSMVAEEMGKEKV